MPDNRLSRETSPYLLQHQDNPVDWRPWGADAMAEARHARKPILLSVGYAACHWCHVMAHESFENPETAAQMNAHFINIKVDREERPDIDAIYQRALAAMGQHGGWPLTMFLTPEGEPFFGGTYFPGEARYGRPGFRDVLDAVATHYAEQPDKVAENVTALRNALSHMGTAQGGDMIQPDLIADAAKRFAGAFDLTHGGIEGAPKFPNPTILELVWRAGQRAGDADLRHCATLTLERMSQGGIYDHLGGGFARYSTDAEWLVPHFEKMLYDNAQLLALLTWAWQETRNPLFEQRIHETVGWIAREMIAEGGGLAATLDADSEGEEGKFYVWTEAEIDRLLGPDAGLFKRIYDVGPAGNWEGKTILHRNHSAGGPLDAEDEARLTASRAKLLAARDQRIRPGWDDKVLADWNGMTIAALAEAGAVLDQPAWVEMAERAYYFVCETMQQDGQLFHSHRAGANRHIAVLDDYAQMIHAAIKLYEITANPIRLDEARGWIAVLDRHFIDAEAGGYFTTDARADDLIVRAKTAADNATPAGNAVLAAAFARLYYLTGNDDDRALAERQITAFAGEVTRNLFPYAGLLNAAALLHDARQIVIAGPDGPDADALTRAAWRAAAPDKVIQRIKAGAELPVSHPAHGKGAGETAALFICRHGTCSAPITDPADVARAL